MKKIISSILSLCLLTGTLNATACTNSNTANSKGNNVLRIASWDEYIDMGGEDSYYTTDLLPIYKELDYKGEHPLAIHEEFEAWYNKQHPDNPITVEYVAMQDNETMYNKVRMGDEYDLLCPSEYMAMKLKAENKLLPFDKEFFDPTIEGNYYAQNVSAYTREIFEKSGLSEYIAGYMWGSTGFIFNPENIGNSPEEARKIMSSWHCLSAPECSRKITAKDNTRDSYFMGLGMYYEEYLLSLDKNAADYSQKLNDAMNDTSQKTMGEVKKLLGEARRNLYGLETDEGKNDVIMGRLDASYQWSGDAVFIMDEAELESGLELEYSIPASASNLWFDGWVMMKGANKEAATAFVNYISRPENIIRNMNYIGYTSCLGGEDVYNYVCNTYAATADATKIVEYDLSYFFGEGHTLLVDEAQTRRQLFAQYPDVQTKNRLVVMDYFTPEENERANRMWNNIK